MILIYNPLDFNHMSPKEALQHAFQQCPLPSSAPDFVTNRAGKPMTGKNFNVTFKNLIKKLGLDNTYFSIHSFCSGGAAWALQCGIYLVK